MIQTLNWWLFAAVLPVLYWLAPAKLRLPALALASLAVLVAIDPIGIAGMLALGLVIYAASAMAERQDGKPANPLLKGLAAAGRSPWLILAVFIYLVAYKYVPAIVKTFDQKAGIASIVAPVGVSYFSFKLAHYAIERRSKTLPPHSLAEFLSWLFLMPTFTAGPIERFEHFLESRAVTFKAAFVVEGGTRIAQGLVKKFVIQSMVNWVILRITGPDIISFAHGTGGETGVWAVWAFLVLDVFAMYLDFSGYSDIAIGASRLFGLTIMENFNYPLLAPSLTAFWQRWHMTLTNWGRIYIFMPMLGATRSPYGATLVTFLVIGVWHAASLQWVAWGLANGLGLSFVLWWGRFAQRRKIKFFRTRLGAVCGWALTMLFVVFEEALPATHPNGTLLDSMSLIARAFGITI